MHALLFGKNEKEILKKCNLAEAYREVALTEANNWMPKTLDEMDTNLTLYGALRDAFGGSGSSDYITDNNLKITQNEDARFKKLQADYTQFYLSAYQAVSQIEDLKTCLKQTDDKEFKAIENNVPEEIGHIADPTEISLRKCYYSWSKFNKGFGTLQ